MKKIFLSIALIGAIIISSAQNKSITNIDKIDLSKNKFKTEAPAEQPPTPPTPRPGNNPDGGGVKPPTGPTPPRPTNKPYTNDNFYPVQYELVDLGLPSGTLWANMNEGTNNPYLPGDYYTFFKAPQQQDLAVIPTKAQWQELIDKCTWTWETVDPAKGHGGYIVKGPNGNSIFVPATGKYQHDNTIFTNGEYGEYWSSTENNGGGLEEGYYLSLKKEKNTDIRKQRKDNGLAVRLVYLPYVIPTGGNTTVNIYYREDGAKVTETTTIDDNGNKRVTKKIEKTN